MIGHKFRIEQSGLHQHTCLVPIYVLVVQLSTSNADDTDESDTDLLVRWWDIWKHPDGLSRGHSLEEQDLPWDLLCMSERYDHLIHDPVGSYSSADELHGHARRIIRNEIILIETLQIRISDTPRKRWNMIYIYVESIQRRSVRLVVLTGLFDHGSHGRRGIFGSKLDSNVLAKGYACRMRSLTSNMLFPNLLQIYFDLEAFTQSSQGTCPSKACRDLVVFIEVVLGESRLGILVNVVVERWRKALTRRKMNNQFQVRWVFGFWRWYVFGVVGHKGTQMRHRLDTHI